MFDDEYTAPTPVEIQAMQSRTIDCSYKVAYAAVIDIFQELGYIIQNSEFSTGLIVAKSSIDDYTSGKWTPGKWTDGKWTPGEWTPNAESTMRWRTATAHIEELSNNQVLIRVSFIAHKQMSNELIKNSESSYAITSAQVYAKFYSKIDNAIFIRKNLR